MIKSERVEQAPHGSTVDPDDVARFERLGAQWWNPRGPMAGLHKMNPVRVGYLRDLFIERFPHADGSARDSQHIRSLEGLNVLDIGCGGGILSEPLARLGCVMTSIDPAPGNVDIAKAHAAKSGLSIDYRAVMAEDLAASGAQFDVVMAMEVVEHVTDVPAFVATACSMVRPGGLFVSATLNRTLKSFALAIVGAEYVLRWVEPGTHKWDQFVTPDELRAAIEGGGLDVFNETGVVYNPLFDRWSLGRDMGVNYMMAAERIG